MGVLGKDLFDYTWPRTHVKVQFGQSSYWVEDKPEPHPYGEVLTELLNYDAAPFEQTLTILEQAIQEDDAHAVPRAFMNAVGEFAALPYFRLFLSDLQRFKKMRVESLTAGKAQASFENYIFSDGKRRYGLYAGTGQQHSVHSGEVRRIFGGSIRRNL